MSGNYGRFWLAAPVLAGLGACALPPPDAGFEPVQHLVQERLGQDVKWRQDPAADQAVAAHLHSLLQGNLTADQAVEIALLNNPQLQAAFEEIGIAQGHLVEAGLLANPSVEISALAATPQTAYSGAIVENFMAVFTRAARQHIAQTALDRTGLVVANTVIEMAASVRAAYWTVIADQQSLALYRDIARMSQLAAELAERQRRAGTLNRRDQAAQQWLYATTLLSQAKLETDLARDRDALSRLLGLSGQDMGWTVPDQLPDIVPMLVPMDRLESLAISRHLDLAAARQDVALAAAGLGLARQSVLFAGLGFGAAVERDADNAHKRGPMVQFSLPIFDWGQGEDRVLAARQRQQERVYQALALDLRSAVRSAGTKLVSAEAMVGYYQKTLLPLQGVMLTETQQANTGMLVGIYDVLQARQNQISVQRDAITALKEYWLARDDLERLLGGNLPPNPDAAAPPPKGAS